MEEFDVRKKVDILITLTISYFFVVCLSFRGLGLESSFENYLMLELVMVIALVSYYTNITLSLVITLVIDFAYMSFKLYLTFSNKLNITTDTYYWIVLLPMTAILVSLLSRNIVKLQEKVGTLMNENSKLVMIDENINMRNERALLMELPIYMKLSTRHKIPVTLFIVRFKFAEKLKNILGKENYEALLIQSSEVFEKSLREEDVKYILDYKTFAFLTITDAKGARIVKERFKENVERFDFSKESFYKNVKLDIQIGNYTFDDSIENPLEFVKLAEKELEYDIQE